MLKLLFILSVIAIPFNDFYPLFPLGEMQSELSVYTFFVTLALFAISQKKLKIQIGNNENTPLTVTQPLLQFAVIMHVIIAVSFVMNFTGMLGQPFHGRYPINKFLTATAVMSYGFILAYMTYILSRIYAWHELVMRPVAISVAICSVIAVFEVLAWAGGGFGKLYTLITHFTHLGFDFTWSAVGVSTDEWIVIGRARSICFEPPSLANFAGFAWPWAYAGISSTKPKHRYVYVGVWLLCTALVLIANSRTSLLLLTGNFLTLFLLRRVYLSPTPSGAATRKATNFALITGTIVILVAIFTNTDVLISAALRGDNVSNVTRLASITAGVKMFLQSPVWGYGFGQYGFHAVETMPTWGYSSWEIISWITHADTWLPVYSIYPRFAAELGILGVLAWIGIWVILARTVWRVTFAYQMVTGKILSVSYPLIISCYGALLSGIPLDSLRTPMMWISMGLCCGYIHDVRLKLLKITQEKQLQQTPPRVA